MVNLGLWPVRMKMLMSLQLVLKNVFRAILNVAFPNTD